IHILFGAAGCARESKLGVDVAGNGDNIVLLGSSEFVLRSRNFDVVGHSRLEAVLRQLKFTLSEVLPLFRDGDLVGSGFQVEQRFLNFLLDPAAQIGNLVIHAFDAAGKFLSFATAVTIEYGEIQLALDCTGPLGAANATT